MKTVSTIVLFSLLFSQPIAAQKLIEASKIDHQKELQIQKDNTKIKLALLAAVVTIAAYKYSDKLGVAIAFDKLIMFLWNK